MGKSVFSVFEKAQGLTDGKGEKTFWFGGGFIRILKKVHVQQYSGVQISKLGT